VNASDESRVERNRSIGNSTRQISKIECRLDEGNKDCGVFKITEVPRMGFVATGSRAPAASAVVLAAAVTAGVTAAAVRMPPAEILPTTVEALRRMPAASHVEAA